MSILGNVSPFTDSLRSRGVEDRTSSENLVAPAAHLPDSPPVPVCAEGGLRRPLRLTVHAVHRNGRVSLSRKEEGGVGEYRQAKPPEQRGRVQYRVLAPS